jgi:Phosphotransferase system, mannose/fructose/N-acetylgalactosamine-specific component IIB
MGAICLTRVDDRLIHGQVMTKWSKGGYNSNAIFVVDDGIAKDPFMKDIYAMSTANSGMTIKVFSVDEAVAYWKKDNFENYRAILLFKTIAAVKEAIEKELPVDTLNVGGISKKKDAKFVIDSVALIPNDVALLKELNANGVKIFFQTVPDTKQVSFENGLKSIS